jgi:hypothetical protein
MKLIETLPHENIIAANHRLAPTRLKIKFDGSSHRV